MTKDELKIILEAHEKWVRSEDGGKRAELSRAYLEGAYLEGADLRGAYLRGAYLRGAALEGAYLEGADLRGAYLRGADLRGADLRGADLRGAYLEGAELEGADLRGAYLRGADLGGDRKVVGLIARVTRIIDPYEFFAWRTDKGDYVKAGCHFMTVVEFRVHVAASYPNTPKAVETLRILSFIEKSFEEAKP